MAGAPPGVVDGVEGAVDGAVVDPLVPDSDGVAADPPVPAGAEGVVAAGGVGAAFGGFARRASRRFVAASATPVDARPWPVWNWLTA